jgi:hypothetical protein
MAFPSIATEMPCQHGGATEQWRAGRRLSQNRLNRWIVSGGGSMADWIGRLPADDNSRNSARNARAGFRARCSGLRGAAWPAAGGLREVEASFSHIRLNRAFRSIFSSSARTRISAWRVRNFSTARTQVEADAMASDREEEMPCGGEEDWRGEQEMASAGDEETTGCWGQAETGGCSGCSLEPRP